MKRSGVRVGLACLLLGVISITGCASSEAASARARKVAVDYVGAVGRADMRGAAAAYGVSPSRMLPMAEQRQSVLGTDSVTPLSIAVTASRPVELKGPAFSTVYDVMLKVCGDGIRGPGGAKQVDVLVKDGYISSAEGL